MEGSPFGKQGRHSGERGLGRRLPRTGKTRNTNRCGRPSADRIRGGWWSRWLTAEAEAVFANGTKAAPAEDRSAELYEQIGRLKVELDWVKKKAAALG